MRAFGGQVRWTLRNLGRTDQMDFLDVEDDDDERRMSPRATALMQVIVSVTVLGIAGAVLLTGPSDDGGKAAWGVIGTIVGYWLH